MPLTVHAVARAPAVQSTDNSRSGIYARRSDPLRAVCLQRWVDGYSHGSLTWKPRR